MRLFIKDESRTAKREGRDTVFTVHNFTRWAAENLNSPRAVWLYSIGFSLGAMFVVFRAAIRSGCVLYTLCSHSFQEQQYQSGKRCYVSVEKSGMVWKMYSKKWDS